MTFHSLRRSFAGLCAEAGVDPAWTAAQIGHASSRFTLDVYTDTSNRRRSPAVEVARLVWGDKGTGAFSNGNGSNGHKSQGGSRITPQGA